MIKNFETRKSDQENPNMENNLNHYNLKPHHEMLKRMNQRQQEKKKLLFYPFPIIEIIS